MKRERLWAIGIGVLVSAGPLAVGQGYAGVHEAKCTLATLQGQYLFTGPERWSLALDIISSMETVRGWTS